MSNKDWDALEYEVAKAIHEWHCPEEDWFRPSSWTGPVQEEYTHAAGAVMKLFMLYLRRL
ncbi:hypothetical protein LCGC14_0757500 [marine sediment metagenome]|uniref:Uncharacterized protein n=1 Tax=marine sediment metagenome TaxID=412755 RepID=A0A0F9T975_9ZZZZ